MTPEPHGLAGPDSPVGPIEGASATRALALTVRFLLELALLVGAGVLAWQLTEGWWRWPAVLVAVVAVAVVWGLFLSPKAGVHMSAPVAFGLEALLFFGVGAGLFGLGYSVAAGLGVGIWLLDQLALGLLRH